MTNYILALLIALSASGAAFAQSPDYIPWTWDDEPAETSNTEAEADDDAGELGW